MKMQYEFSENNILRMAEKTVKKDDGIKSVLSLLQDVRDFKDKIDVCLEAQSEVETRQRIERFQGDIEKMYTELLSIAGGGIKDIRTRPESEEQYSGDTLPQESIESTVETPVEPSMDM